MKNSSPSPSLKYYNITWDAKQIFVFYWVQVLWHECLISLEIKQEATFPRMKVKERIIPALNKFQKEEKKTPNK